MGISLIIKSSGNNVRHISEGTFFPFSQIKFRTVELGFSCSLKNTIPIGPLCQAHWHKVVTGQLIAKKLNGFCWKIHVDLKSGNGLTVNKLLGFFLKCFCIPGIQKHLERGIDWLVKQCFIESKLCDLLIGIQDFLDTGLYQRRGLGGCILFFSDGIRDNHVIQPGVEKDSHNKYRNRDGNTQYNGKF